MEFFMMAVDGNRLFDACKRFLIMDLESIEKCTSWIGQKIVLKRQ